MLKPMSEWGGLDGPLNVSLLTALLCRANNSSNHTKMCENHTGENYREMIQKSNASAIGASAKQSMETQYDLLSRKGWKTDKPSWQHSQKIPTATTISENLFLSSEVNMNFKIFEGYVSSSSSLCGASISCFLSGKGTPHDGGFDEWVLAQQVNEIMKSTNP